MNTIYQQCIFKLEYTDMQKKDFKKRAGEVAVYIQNRLWYIIVIAILAFASGFMFLYDYFGKDLSPLTIDLLYDLDLAIAFIFLADFCVSMFFSGRGLRYIPENLLDFLGSLPFSDGFFQVLRILRFTRLVRVLRGINTGLNVHDSIKKLREDQKKKVERMKKIGL